MPQIVQAGSINTAALTVPDLYVQIVPPQLLSLNGVPTNLLGIVGTASWGPVNVPVGLGNLASYNVAFGPVRNAPYDAGTAVNVAEQLGAAAFMVVRVTDGTDTAATATVGALALTALYTGSVGNTLLASLSVGSKTGTQRLTLTMPGVIGEVYDNIPYTAGKENAFWTAAAAAVNSGNSVLRGPSALAVAAVSGAGTSVPAVVTNAPFTGGTDGAAGVTSALLVGVDGVARSGMYALRGKGCSVCVLSGAYDFSQWGAQVSFGLSENVYMVMASISGDTISGASTTKGNAGIDSYTAKLMFGDWLYFYDQTNAVTRLVSPALFAAGELVNLAPNQSSLNKPLTGIIGSQKSGLVSSGTATAYSEADLSTLFSAGLDVICNPAPGGRYWAVRSGHNSSSNAAINGDAYTRMTNFLAATLAAGMGGYVGQPITPDLLLDISATLTGFLSGVLLEGYLSTGAGGAVPYSVVCNASNNPQSRTSLGYVQADVAVTYQGINEKFIVNLQGGATVTIPSQAA